MQLYIFFHWVTVLQLSAGINEIALPVLRILLPPESLCVVTVDSDTQAQDLLLVISIFRTLFQIYLIESS